MAFWGLSFKVSKILGGGGQNRILYSPRIWTVFYLSESNFLFYETFLDAKQLAPDWSGLLAPRPRPPLD